MKAEVLKSRREVNLHPVHWKDFTVKAAQFDEATNTITGYLSVFGIKDSDGDILIKGCFSKSLTERGPGSMTARKIAFLWMHDMEDPIGRFTSLQEDDYGLKFSAQLDAGVENADRCKIQLKSGTLNQFSIGFQYIWDKMEYDEIMDAYIVKEVDLFEGSVVTLAANEYASFTGFKSQQLTSKKQELIEETEAFIKSLPFGKQYLLREIIAKNINLAMALKAQDTTDSDADTEGAGDVGDTADVAYIDQAVPMHSNCNQLIDKCQGSMKNESLTTLCDSMKSMHTDCMTKMLNIRAEITGTKKSLNVSTEPEAQPLSRKNEPTGEQGLDVKQLLKIF